MADTIKNDGRIEEGRRPYDIPPTLRTYVTQSWKNPEMRREILSLLAHDYDWYLERMLAGMYGARDWPKSDMDDCLSDVKVHFFFPSDEVMHSETRRFWVESWDRTTGPLRNYFRQCVRNFVTDRWRRQKNNVTGATAVPIGNDGGLPLPDDGQTPAQAALVREFEARYDAKAFIDRALSEYEAECGDRGGAAVDRWLVYSRFISLWPQPTMEDLAKTLGMTCSRVNNHVHHSRVRIKELFWLLIRGMEMDDDAADQAMVAMVGMLPPCRAKGGVPAWPGSALTKNNPIVMQSPTETA